MRTPSSHSTDSRPHSGPSTCSPHPPRLSTSCVPFPFSKISRYMFAVTTRASIDGPPPRPHQDSPGLSSCVAFKEGHTSPPVGCWSSQMAFISRRSCWSVAKKQISSWQRVWWRGVPIPLNPPKLMIAPQVCFLQRLRPVPTLRLRLDWEPPVLIDLSTTTKLKDLAFWCQTSAVEWITIALQSLGSKNLQRVALRPCPGLSGPARQEWHDLDRLLLQLQLRTSPPIRPKVTYGVDEVVKSMFRFTQYLLPELTSRELVGLVVF